jgi:hypothetical protein
LSIIEFSLWGYVKYTTHRGRGSWFFYFSIISFTFSTYDKLW